MSSFWGCFCGKAQLKRGYEDPITLASETPCKWQAITMMDNAIWSAYYCIFSQSDLSSDYRTVEGSSLFYSYGE